MNACINILSGACHAAILNNWGSTIELTVSLWEIFQIFLSISAVLFIRKIFSDELRKAIFWGFVPTLIVVVKDITGGKYILVGKTFLEKEDKAPTMAWLFPQASMRSANLDQETSFVLKSRLGMDVDQYKTTDKEMLIGKRKISGLKKPMKQELGFSFFHMARGRIYMVTMVKADIREKKDGLYVLGRKLQSVNVDDIKLLDADEALEKVKASHQGYGRRDTKVEIFEKIFEWLND
ncbi:MAG: hypothetical protein Fur003_3490 [Candidatus Dojkabacteria bacterium]